MPHLGLDGSRKMKNRSNVFLYDQYLHPHHWGRRSLGLHLHEDRWVFIYISRLSLTSFIFLLK